MELKQIILARILDCSGSFNRTKWNWNVGIYPYCSGEYGLLIVLNGIETALDIILDELGPLLIVLNGIETTAMDTLSLESFPFNRTKWNWNSEHYAEKNRSESLLIVLNGIETSWRLGQGFLQGQLLIVLNGIETTVRIRTKRRYILLLIVLNGIETDFPDMWCKQFSGF